MPEGASPWFARRLVEPARRAGAAGLAPESPGAEPVLRELLGDGDRVGVLVRLRASFSDRVARYRELLGTARGAAPPPAHREEFAWVAAALVSRVAS